MSEDPQLQPPSSSLVAGKYQLHGLIGRGGMGSVWEGKHVSLGTRVAIKFIEKEYAESREARSRFDNEARAAATIQSKHAIQIFDHGVTEDGRPYIVMELLEGEPLDKRLERVRRLPLQETARLLSQVCRALQRAHDGGIVHRDLKPENIFLCRSPDDDDEYAKVLDFGIAKIRGPAGQQLSSSTKTGAVLGTPYYMSPEQARGLRDVDHRTDLWSLGVIVFKCVTGVLPFDGESLGDLLVKICTAPMPVPSQVLPGLPPAFDAWFARALEREPQRRFASATEMSDALAYACGLSVKRSPGSGPGPQGIPLGGATARLPSVPPPGGAVTPGYGSNPGYSQSGGHMTPPPTLQSGTPAQGAYASARGPNATSAPFTASTPHAKVGSGGRVFLLAGLGVLFAGIGAAVVYKATSHHDTVTVEVPGAKIQIGQQPAAAGPGTDSAGAAGTGPAGSASQAPLAATSAAPLVPPPIASSAPAPVTAPDVPQHATHTSTTKHSTKPSTKPSTTASTSKPTTSTTTATTPTSKPVEGPGY